MICRDLAVFVMVSDPSSQFCHILAAVLCSAEFVVLELLQRVGKGVGWGEIMTIFGMQLYQSLNLVIYAAQPQTESLMQ